MLLWSQEEPGQAVWRRDYPRRSEAFLCLQPAVLLSTPDHAHAAPQTRSTAKTICWNPSSILCQRGRSYWKSWARKTPSSSTSPANPTREVILRPSSTTYNRSKTFTPCGTWGSLTTRSPSLNTPRLKFSTLCRPNNELFTPLVQARQRAIYATWTTAGIGASNQQPDDNCQDCKKYQLLLGCPGTGKTQVVKRLVHTLIEQ